MTGFRIADNVPTNSVIVVPISTYQGHAMFANGSERDGQ